MKKNALSLAVATSVAALSVGTVQANMYLNQEGTGEVLLFPFFDAENGNATNMHIVNTTSDVKAVKVRFLEYKSSYEVLDFNLYLSPKDHFAFGVIMDPNGTGGALITSDNSCTVPALGSPNNGFDGTTTENADGSITRVQPFVNFEFLSGEFVDDAPARTLRGHVEVIEMGVVGNGPVVNAGAPTPGESASQHATFATHGADGVPANCAGLEGSWAQGVWGSTATDTNPGPQFAITDPSGGLYGLSYHINVEDANAWGIEPAAIADWSGAGDKLHAVPGTVNPSLSSTSVTSSIVLENGTSTALTWGDSIDAVSSLFMTQAIINDVMLNATIGGATDWATTFPTKRDYVTTGYTGADPVKAPFTKPYYGTKLNAAGTAYEEKLACEPVVSTSTDREEAAKVGGNNFSPLPPGAAGNVLCDEQNTVAWGTGTESAMNVERDLYNLGFAYTEGWARWDFDGAKNSMCPVSKGPNNVTAALTDCLIGLPAMGFAAYSYANGSAGVLMNYGHAADHKTNVQSSAAERPPSI